jgi:hypothetical protein
MSDLLSVLRYSHHARCRVKMADEESPFLWLVLAAYQLLESVGTANNITTAGPPMLAPTIYSTSVHEYHSEVA